MRALPSVLRLPGEGLRHGVAGSSAPCGLAAGAVALVAIVRRRERAVTVFAALLPSVFVVVFVVAELIVPHA